MAILEKLEYSKDGVADAIKKLDRNQKLVGGETEDLRNKINVLNDYKYHPTITTPNNLPSGKWYMRSPDNPTDDFYYIDCGISPASGYMYQRARYVFWNQSYDRVQIGGVWKAWQQIATTTKTSFLCTAASGMTITVQNCYTMNGMAYINATVKKTDGSVFGVAQHLLFTTPYYSKTARTPMSVIFADVVLVTPFTWNGGVWIDGGCYIVTSTATVKEITVHAEVPL